MPQRLRLKRQRTRRLKRPLVVAPRLVAMRLSEEQARQRMEVVAVVAVVKVAARVGAKVAI